MASSSLHAHWHADHNLHTRSTLEKLETQFLFALQNDGAEGRMLDDFYTSYSRFQEELQNSHLLLSPDLKEEIANFVTLVATTSTNLVEATSPAIIDEFKSNLLGAMAPLHLDHASERQRSPRYIEDSLRWLRQNLHNPYPSRSVRNSIAAKTNSSVKDVDAWFIDIRKRIGWSHLRQSRFGNRMGKIVNAAKRFFTGFEPHRPLETIVESEFASIAATLEELYQDKCASSALASCLDDSVRDLTPDLQQSLMTQKRRAHLDARTSKLSRRPQPYPSPESSPTLSSQTLSPPKPPSIRLPALEPSERRNKRSHSLSTDCSTDNEEYHIRTVKRRRYSSIPTPGTPQLSCYPSPAASIVMKQAELPVEHHVSAEVAPRNAGKRKRTVSDAGITLSPPPRESASQPSTFSNPPPLSVDDILDQAVLSSPSVTAPSVSLVVQPGAYNPYNAFAAFFTAFTGAGSDAFNAASPQPLNQLPVFNIVDDVPPANVHVEYDQSWSLDYNADELVPSIDMSITGIDFDDFGSSLYSDSTNLLGGPSQPWGSFWLAAPSQEPYAGCSSSGSTTSSPLDTQLNPITPSHTFRTSPPAAQLYLSTPSPTSAYHCLDIPEKSARKSFPLSVPPSSESSDQLPCLAHKAKELMELEARCAALRSELTTAC